MQDISLSKSGQPKKRKPSKVLAAQRAQMRRAYTVAEAGRILGISRPSADLAANDGTLPTVRLGKRLIVPAAALARLLGEDE